MKRIVHWADQTVSIDISEGSPTICLGINGKSSNPDRHAISLTPAKAREIAKLLNAAADLA